MTPYQSAFLTGPNVINITLQDHCAEDFSEHLAIIYDPIALHYVLNALDAEASPAPCVFVPPIPQADRLAVPNPVDKIGLSLRTSQLATETSFSPGALAK